MVRRAVGRGERGEARASTLDAVAAVARAPAGGIQKRPPPAKETRAARMRREKIEADKAAGGAANSSKFGAWGRGPPRNLNPVPVRKAPAAKVPEPAPVRPVPVIREAPKRPVLKPRQKGESSAEEDFPEDQTAAAKERLLGQGIASEATGRHSTLGGSRLSSMASSGPPRRLSVFGGHSLLGSAKKKRPFNNTALFPRLPEGFHAKPMPFPTAISSPITTVPPVDVAAIQATNPDFNPKAISKANKSLDIPIGGWPIRNTGATAATGGTSDQAGASAGAYRPPSPSTFFAGMSTEDLRVWRAALDAAMEAKKTPKPPKSARKTPGKGRVGVSFAQESRVVDDTDHHSPAAIPASALKSCLTPRGPATRLSMVKELSASPASPASSAASPAPSELSQVLFSVPTAAPSDPAPTDAPAQLLFSVPTAAPSDDETLPDVTASPGSMHTLGALEGSDASTPKASLRASPRLVASDASHTGMPPHKASLATTPAKASPAPTKKSAATPGLMRTLPVTEAEAGPSAESTLLEHNVSAAAAAFPSLNLSPICGPDGPIRRSVRLAKSPGKSYK